ncbi:MAG TPA: DASS family sodium-coupled anion symporter [Chitinophagaceae bacterium]
MDNTSLDILTISNSKRSIYYFLGTLVVAIGLTFLVRKPSFTDSQLYVLFLVFFSIGLWITEAIPPFAVSLFILAYLVFTMGNPHLNDAPEKIDKYVNTFSSSVIWLLLGGFFMSASMSKTGLDRSLLKLTLKIPGRKPQNILLALMATTMFASMIMSYSATAAMVIAAILPLLSALGKSEKSKALLLGISISAAIGGMGTIIASSTNAVAAGLLEKSDVKIDFWSWMLYGIPVAFVLNAICCFVLVRLYIRDAQPVSLSFLAENKVQVEPSLHVQRIIVLAVIIVTVLFWLTTSIHGITVAAISAIPIVILTVTGVLTAHDIRVLPWDTLFLVAGGLSLGVAIESASILDHYSYLLTSIKMSPLFFLLLLAYLTMFLSNFMSNIASCMLIIPLGMTMIPEWKTEVGMTVGLAASAGLFLPVSTPPNVICYSTGLLKQKDFRIGGVIVGLLGPLLIVLWVWLLRSIR